MLREYEWAGSTWQFEEADAPQGAVPLGTQAALGREVAGAPGEGAKQADKRNKSRRPRTKAAQG